MAHYCNRPTPDGVCRRRVTAPGAPCGAEHRARRLALAAAGPTLVHSAPVIDPMDAPPAPGTSDYLRSDAADGLVADNARRQLHTMRLDAADAHTSGDARGGQVLDLWAGVHDRFVHTHADATQRWLARFHERHDRWSADTSGFGGDRPHHHEQHVALAADRDPAVRQQVPTTDLEPGDVVHDPESHDQTVGVVVDPSPTVGSPTIMWVAPDGGCRASGPTFVGGDPRPVSVLGNVHSSI
jgi:hypothetical protein